MELVPNPDHKPNLLRRFAKAVARKHNIRVGRTGGIPAVSHTPAPDNPSSPSRAVLTEEQRSFSSTEAMKALGLYVQDHKNSSPREKSECASNVLTIVRGILAHNSAYTNSPTSQGIEFIEEKDYQAEQERKTGYLKAVETVATSINPDYFPGGFTNFQDTLGSFYAGGHPETFPMGEEIISEILACGITDPNTILPTVQEYFSLEGTISLLIHYISNANLSSADFTRVFGDRNPRALNLNFLTTLSDKFDIKRVSGEEVKNLKQFFQIFEDKFLNMHYSDEEKRNQVWSALRNFFNTQPSTRQYASNLVSHLSNLRTYFELLDVDLLRTILWEIHDKKTLTKGQLTFLYEILSPIEGGQRFTNAKTIKDLRSQRNLEEDMAVIFGCEKSQIAHKGEDIEPNTKVYKGPLVPGIFNLIGKYGIDWVYTTFPRGRVELETIRMGDTTIEQIREALGQSGLHRLSIDLLFDKLDSASLTKPQTITLTRLSAKELGITGEKAALEEIYLQAQNLGLTLCSIETGVILFTQYAKDPINKGKHIVIAINPIVDSLKIPTIMDFFPLKRGLQFTQPVGQPGSLWSSDQKFVFSLHGEKA